MAMKSLPNWRKRGRKMIAESLQSQASRKLEDGETS
jgi:hypothetical protein